MTDDIIHKTVPLPIASCPDDIANSDTPEAHEARIQAHMNRVHPKIDAIEKEESRVRRASGSPAERERCNKNRQRRQRALAKRRKEAERERGDV